MSNRARLGRFLLVLLPFVAYVYLSLSLHEIGHLLTARALGVAAHIDYTWLGGTTILDGPVGPGQYRLITLAGGLLLGLVASFLWYVSHKQLSQSLSEVDTAWAWGVIALWNLIYAFFDGYKPWVHTWAFVAALGIVTWLYLGTLKAWVMGEPRR